ncbi:hypothetical protein FAM09_13730 [Niastella caeni]|uniref:Polymer-forming cytoskeletal protein n=1 Tax=Niastella caeni TaxID=2569763 RepID=A0A4S8HXN7_9BACT|nr:hypothetical protein [Niastella caeni]THU39559.1 hypothetical protein FAM09_13730 [Niastella caeni]
MKHIFLLMIMLSIMCSVKAIRIQSGKNLVIDKPVYEDVYIAGGDIIINAPVYGDLIVTGGTVTINDSISNDILAAGGTISFNGYVGDDIRCAGGKLNIFKNVAGDVVVTGGKIAINKDAVIGNLISAGGEITIDGQVTGSVRSASGELLLNGAVMKDIDCRGGDITINGSVNGRSVLVAGDELTIGNTAAFNNDVRYWSPSRDVNFNNSVKKGQAIYDPSLRIDREHWYFLGFSSVFGLLWYVGMVFIMIMIIQHLFGRTMKKAGQTAYDKALRSFGYGFLFWIGVPVAAAIACITIIGVPVGVILLFSYIILAVFAGTITSVVAANWLNSRSATNWSYWRMVFVALGIFIIFRIVSLTPFFGWFIFALLVCIAFGSVLLNVNWRRSPQ